jgi:predicted outer membrane lipoprotein
MILNKVIAFGVIVALPAMWLSCSSDQQTKSEKSNPVLQSEYIDCELLNGLVTTKQDTLNTREENN